MFHLQTLKIPYYQLWLSPIAVYDFNRDHHADIMVWFDHKTLAVLLGDGKLGFQDLQSHAVQNWQWHGYRIADVNNDGPNRFNHAWNGR